MSFHLYGQWDRSTIAPPLRSPSTSQGSFYTWWKASLLVELLWLLCTCSNLVWIENHNWHFHFIEAILPSDRLDSARSSSFHWDWYLYGAPKEHWDKPLHFKGPHPHATFKPLWTKTSHVWNSRLVEKVLNLAFQQTMIDECVFYCNGIIVIVMLMMVSSCVK